MSLLESQGQPEASQYPLWYLGEETEIVARRINVNLRTEAALLSMAFASTQSKKGAKAFQKTLEKLE